MILHQDLLNNKPKLNNSNNNLIHQLNNKIVNHHNHKLYLINNHNNNTLYNKLFKNKNKNYRTFREVADVDSEVMISSKTL